MISVHQMGEVIGKISGCSCTQLAEFYSTEAGVSFRRCCFRKSVKQVANDGYSYFFVRKCTSKRGLRLASPVLPTLLSKIAMVLSS